MLSVSESGELDAAWLSSKLGRHVVRASIRNMDDKKGGMVNPFERIEVTCEDGALLSLVLKSSPTPLLPEMVKFGLAREALFYNEFASRLGDLVPKSYFAYGDMTTGAKQVMLEDLKQFAPVGVFFDPEQPNNIAVDVEALKAEHGNPSAKALSAKAFAAYAKMHAEFWMQADVLQHSWLRGAQWRVAEERGAWEATIDGFKATWASIQKSCKDGSAPVRWDEHLVACIDASLSKATWDNLQKEYEAVPWTLVQGDAHPGNMMCRGEEELKLIDFEVIGVGSGAQELGQFLISHMTPQERRACEEELVRGYFAQLKSNLEARGLASEASAYSWDTCWSEYKIGGAGRWIFMLLVMHSMGMSSSSPQTYQYFLDHNAAFYCDHITPESMGVPRL